MAPTPAATDARNGTSSTVSSLALETPTTGSARMGIDLGVAVSGKMLSGRDHAVVLKSTHECRAQPRRQCWILAVGPRIDDRIGGIVIDVENRCVGDVDAQSPSLERCHSTLLVGERRVAGGSKRHLRRKDDRATQVDGVREEPTAPCAVAGAKLEVGAEKQWNAAHPLHGVELYRDLHGRSHRHREPADTLFLDQASQRLPLWGIARGIISVHGRPYHLRRFLSKRQRREHRIHPVGRGPRGRDGDTSGVGRDRRGGRWRRRRPRARGECDERECPREGRGPIQHMHRMGARQCKTARAASP